MFAHFSRPKQKFLADMLYGIQASGDTMLSSVMRAINDDADRSHAVEKRLSRNVADERIGEDIDQAVLAEGAKHVGDDTLILVDPTEIRKEFGLHMEHVTMVRDASRSSKEGRDVTVHGYHGFENIRVLSYCGIRNRASIVLATAYFASVWLGRHVKREVLAKHLEALSQRLGKFPEFANYAIADGLKFAFTKFGRWCRRVFDTRPDPSPSEMLPCLPGMEEFFLPDVF